MIHYPIIFSIFVAVLIPVTIIDIQKHIIPDLIIIPGIFVLITVGTILGMFSHPLVSLLNLGVGFLSFFLIWYFSKGKMGLGDAKLSAFTALVLGIRGWLLMVFISSFVAVIFAVTMLVFKRMRKEERIPFAPFLSLGAVVSYLLISGV